jgi:hypothetical protein
MTNTKTTTTTKPSKEQVAAALAILAASKDADKEAKKEAADKAAREAEKAGRNSTITCNIAGNDVVVSAKAFTSGSDGYFSNGKVAIGTERYTWQVQLVRIGSKPAKQ